MKATIQAAILLAVLQVMAAAGEPRRVSGRVVNENGEPVAGADVAGMWGANGVPKGKDGKPLQQLEDEVDQREFWGHLGQMEPLGDSNAKTGPDGKYSIEVDGDCHAILVMDKARSRGGLAAVSQGDPSAPVDIRIGPTIHVHGSFEWPTKGATANWAGGFLNVPDEVTRPLDNTRIVRFGSFGARIDVLLPPGHYFLEANNSGSQGGSEFRLGYKEIVLSSGVPDVDLGVMSFHPSTSIGAKQRAAQAAGTWWDYTKHYGEKPPAWHAVDARGVVKDVRLEDFKGKWVLLDLWGLSCTPCLATTAPKLMKFYEEHAKQRDRFEIVSVCIDYEGELKSLADLDKKLQPIVEHVWHGKTIPFPILLDNTYTTLENFGLPGFGTLILIDPEGRMVEGDETVLAQKLRE